MNNDRKSQEQKPGFFCLLESGPGGSGTGTNRHNFNIFHYREIKTGKYIGVAAGDPRKKKN